MSEKKRPMDLGLALQKNPEAVRKYEAMNEYGKSAVCQWASQLKTQEELDALVEDIAQGSTHDYY